jgi:hypothetical protein
LPDFSLFNIPKWGKIFQIDSKLPNGHKIFQLAIEFTNFLHSKSIQNLPEFGFFSHHLATLINRLPLNTRFNLGANHMYDRELQRQRCKNLHTYTTSID